MQIRQGLYREEETKGEEWNTIEEGAHESKGSMRGRNQEFDGSYRRKDIRGGKGERKENVKMKKEIREKNKERKNWREKQTK